MRKRFLLLTLGGLLTSLLVFLPHSLSDAPPQDSEFVYARIRYHMSPNAFFMREAPSHHDYPYGDAALPTHPGEESRDRTGSTPYKIVHTDSRAERRYPTAYHAKLVAIDQRAADV